MPYNIPVRYLSCSTSNCPFELDVTWNWTSSAVGTVGTSGHFGRCQHHTPPKREQFSKTPALPLKRPQNFTGVYIPYNVLVSISLPLTITSSSSIDLFIRSHVIYQLRRHHSHIHQHVAHHSRMRKLYRYISNGMLKLHCHVSSRMLRLLRLKDWIFSPLHISEPPFPELTD